MRKEQWLAAAWTGFLGAALLELLVFGVTDPAEVHLPMLGPHPSTMTIYAVAFFTFWLCTFFSSSLTVLLLCKANSLNDKSSD
jgi:hypothetical protein